MYEASLLKNQVRLKQDNKVWHNPLRWLIWIWSHLKL